MKKVIQSGILIMMMIAIPFLTGAGVQESRELIVTVKPTILSATITFGTNMLINPQEPNEEDIIKTSDLFIKNLSAAPIIVSFANISYLGMYENGSFVPKADGPNNFICYTNNRKLNENFEPVGEAINWSKLGTLATHKNIALAIKDGSNIYPMIPSMEQEITALASKFAASGNEKTFTVGLKAGYAWGGSHAGQHAYNVTFILKLSDDDV